MMLVPRRPPSLPALPRPDADVALQGLRNYLAPSAPAAGALVPAAMQPGQSIAQYAIEAGSRLAGIPALTLPNLPQPTSVAAGGAASAPSGGSGGSSGSMYASEVVPGKAPIGGYPAARVGSLIGLPFSGTHTLGNWESDNAVDIALPYGTPILASFNGTIGPQFGSLGSGNPRFAGLRLHLVGNGQEAYYAHLSKFAPGIRPGTRVRRGQVIGYSGAANGVNHLHFAVHRGDPRNYAPK